MRVYQPVKLSDYCEITSSKRIYAKEYIDSGVPFYRGKEIVASFSGGEVSDPLFISENRFEEIKHRFGAPEKGDLLLTSVGTIGVPYRVTGEFDFYFKDGNLTWFRKLNGVDQNFLYYWLQSPQGKAELSKCTIGAAQPAYTIERLKEISIELPPENIQRDIASVIADYDIALKNNRRRIQLLEESARLLYQEWFIHLRFPGHEQVKIDDGVPEGWESTLLPDVIDVNPRTPAEKGKEIWYVPMSSLSESAMTAHTADFERRTNHTNVKFKKNDVLVARITPCLENGKTGYAYFLAEDEVACGSTEFIVLRGKRVPSEFVYCLARSYPFRENAIKSMTGSSGRQRVQNSCFDKYAVPLPPKSILDEFVQIVQNNFEQIRNLMAQNAKLAQARDLLLPKLMSGELTV